MAVDIGPRIGIQGEGEFRKQLQNVNQSIKTLQSEMKAVTSEFADNADAEKRLAAQNQTLNKTIEQQEQKLKLLQDGLQKSAEQYGENDTKTLKWQQAVNDATDALNKSKNALANNEAAMRDLGNETEETAKETSRLGDVFKGSLLSDIVMRGIDMLVDGLRKMADFLKSSVTDSAEFADNILTLSKQTGMSTDKLQELSYMSELVDVSVESIAGSMKRLSKNMLAAEDGTGTAADAFKELGIEVTDASGNLRDNEDVFAEIIDALGAMDDETRRDATAMQLFGKSATDLNPLILAGGDAIEDFAKEAHDMGYVLDTETLESLGEVQDGFDRFKALGTTVKNQIGAALAPSIKKLTDKLTELVKKVDWNRLVNGLLNILDFAIEFSKYAVPLAAAFGAFKLLTNAQKAVKNFGNSLTTMLTTPAGIAITTLTTLVTIITSIKESWKNSPLGQIVSQTKEATDNWRDFLEVQQESANDGLAEIAYMQELKTELDGLVDANGKVKEGYEGRVSFILNELREATGMELEMIDDSIVGYKDLSKAIDDALESQQIDAILQSKKAIFDEAVVGLADSQDRLNGIIKDSFGTLATYLTESNTTLKMQASAQLYTLRETAADEKALQDEMTAGIQDYSDSYELALTDKTEFLKQNGIATQNELQSQINNEAAIFADGAETVGDAAVGMVDEVGQRTQEAVATAGFAKAGEDAIQGFANGLNSYKSVQWVVSAAKAIARTAMQSLRAGLDEHSPSREMMKIGELASEGFAIGLTKGITYVNKAMGAVVSATTGMSGVIPTPQPTMSSLMAGAVNGIAASNEAASGGSLTVNLVMPDGKRLAQETIKDFIAVGRANGTPITAY